MYPHVKQNPSHPAMAQSHSRITAVLPSISRIPAHNSPRPNLGFPIFGNKFLVIPWFPISAAISKKKWQLPNNGMVFPLDIWIPWFPLFPPFPLVYPLLGGSIHNRHRSGQIHCTEGQSNQGALRRESSPGAPQGGAAPGPHGDNSPRVINNSNTQIY